jgi:hypothetical protein
MFLRVNLCLWGLLLFPIGISAQAQQVIAGRRAVVSDERLSALRERPDQTASIKQRLRRGRVIGITGAARGKDGLLFFHVVVTRRTEGWILAAAVIRAGHRADVERLLKLIEASDDEFARIRLGRLCADEFRGTRTAARALLLLGETADRAAARLTAQAQRRLKAGAEEMTLDRRVYLLNDVALDRYNRIGVRFKTDEAGEKLIYDGGAYRELIRKYPRATEAIEAKKKL